MSRTCATSNITVFVAPPAGTTIPAGAYYGPSGGTPVNGNDATGDGSMGSPFATPQHAAGVLYETYDFTGQFAPTIQLACAPNPAQLYYPPLQISGQLLGQPGSLPPLVVGGANPNYDIGKYNPFMLQGDPNYPLGAFLCSGDFGFPADRPALSLSDGAGLKINGITVDAGLSKQDCIDVMRDSIIEITNVVWGNAGSSGGNIHLGVAFDSTAIFSGNCQLDGSAYSWCQLGQGSSAAMNNNGGEGSPITFTIEPGLKFPQGFIACAGNASFFAGGMKFQAPGGGPVSLAAGSVPVLVTDDSCVDTGGALNIPGTVAAVVLDNSVYK